MPDDQRIDLLPDCDAELTVGDSANGTRPTLSVAMATFNGEQFLREQFASIAAQTLPPDELVISDDGSTDDTLEIVRDFARTAPFPVRVLDKAERLGFADNFLHAAENCRSELVAFCDQDDEWLPRKLEVGVNRLIADGSLLSMHRLQMTDVELRPTAVWDQGIVGDAVHEALTLDPYITGWGNSMVFRRELALLIPRRRRPPQPGEQRPLSHDTWLYVLAAALGRVSHIAEPLLLYRQHGGNAMGQERQTLAKRVQKKLYTLRTVSDKFFRERAVFNDRIEALLRDLAHRVEAERATAAIGAADRIAARSRLLRRRLAIYDGRSLVDRTAAWSALVRKGLTDDVRPSPASLVKDFMLGVMRLGRRQ